MSNYIEKFQFGDSPRMADKLLSLVLDGTKTATCSALQEYKDANEPIPTVGKKSIVLNSSGTPKCMIETTQVDIKKFSEIDAAFAYAEGEGDRSLEYWQKEHQRFFEESGNFSPDMELVCEHFHLTKEYNFSISKSDNGAERKTICQKITLNLPEWFGKEDANQQYAKDAENYEGIIAYNGSDAIGLLIYKEKNGGMDIHWMGVLKEFHRLGIGKMLFEDLKKHVSLNHNKITVETLDPDIQDSSYLKTYDFYKSLGFSDDQKFTYDDGTKMIRMVSNL